LLARQWVCVFVFKKENILKNLGGGGGFYIWEEKKLSYNKGYSRSIFITLV